MKTLLICPALRPAVQQLAVDRPLITTAVLGESLLGHWIEHVAALGARHVKIVVADRAGLVDAVVGDGARWGVKIELIVVPIEPTSEEAEARYGPGGESGWLPSPHQVILLSHLPGAPDLPLFKSYAGWFAAVLAWMPRSITPTRVRVSELYPGIWVGRRAKISKTATLIAPCWIGDQVFIEPGAVVGPAAIIEDRAVIERHTHITQSWVGSNTLVGRMTLVTNSLAWGNTLTNLSMDSSLQVTDPFLLCSLTRKTATTPLGRMARAFRWLVRRPKLRHPPVPITGEHVGQIMDQSL